MQIVSLEQLYAQILQCSSTNIIASSSLSCILQRSSSPKNLRKQQVIKYYYLSCSCVMQAPNAKSNASIFIYSSSFLLNVANVSRSMHTCLSNLKALSCSCPYLNSVSFCVRLVSGKAFLVQFLIKRQLKFIKPRKFQNFINYYRIQVIFYNLYFLIAYLNSVSSYNKLQEFYFFLVLFAVFRFQL